MIREFTEKNLGYQTVLKGVFSQYVALLCRAYMDRAPGDDSSLPLAQTVSHMETHFHDPLRLEDLACRAHYSVDYLLKLRVQQAGELLKDGSHSITAISQACGFSDSNYFSRQFRRVMGRTPRAFRRTFSEII
ncbi:MAG: AraC family transcriptional regulator [Verrucomicrobiota bacterium]|nr:AraC family transcriptional regulator [Verrucomicrobiota bacterium]